MLVNSKKNIRLKNRTYFFDPSKDKTHVRFASPFSYQSRRSRIEGYESRLYWQFRYCQDHDGQTFFYTLTYNNKSIPYHYGTYCFDYENLRDLLCGGFRKMLLRKFGTSFKYFISAELGDGKGKRGLHNNPHYHVLFFLESACNSNFRYRKITPLEFRHLVRLYWQGFDQDEGFKSFKSARFGICQEGENLGLVSDFRAVVYVAKYVCKDVALKKHEDSVQDILRMKYITEYKDSDSFALDFLHEKVYPLYHYNYSDDCSLEDDFVVVRSLLPDDYFQVYVDIFGNVPLEIFRPSKDLIQVVKFNNLWKLYQDYFDFRVADSVRLGLNEWRNRFCNKCRISHGVGDYCLQFVKEQLCPLIPVPSKKGFKYRTPCLYFYRKLFTSEVTPISFIGFGKRKGEVKKYSNTRVLNDLGISYKVNSLFDRAFRLSSKVLNLSLKVLSDKDLFDKIVCSDVNTEVNAPFSFYVKFLNSNSHGECWRRICESYAFYKLVYEDRFFKIDCSGFDGSLVFPSLDYLADYRRFLRSSAGFVSRNSLQLDSFIESGCSGYLPYSQHKDFARYWCVFPLFDLCADYFFVKEDDFRQKQAEELAAVKRFHVNRDVSNILNNL